MATLKDLASRMTKLAGTVGERANERKKFAAEIILRDLLFYTPVDVSTALSNWQIGIGAPALGVIPAYAPGVKGSTRERSAQSAYTEGVAMIAQAKPGEAIHATNNTPYIRKLNSGSSRQEPAGFVERARALGRAVSRGDV